MRRRLVIGAGVLLVILAFIAIAIRRYLSAPLYQPGMARAARASRAPASGHDERFRTAEPGIRLSISRTERGARCWWYTAGPVLPSARRGRD